MKFLADYTSKEAIKAGKHAMVDMLNGDGYYAMYSNVYGTQQIHKEYNKSECYWKGINTKNLTIDNMICEKVSWTSCANNVIAYQHCYINNVECMLVSIDSRRHGIPCNAMKGFEPSEILNYESSAEWWGPFDTLDDHPNDKELFEPPSEWEDGDEYCEAKSERMSRF